MPQLPRPQRPPQISQKAAFFRGPGRGQQFTGGRVALEAMNDDVRRDARQGGAEKIDIFIAPEGVVLACGVLAGKFRPLGHVNVVQFETAYRQGERPFQTLQKMSFIFAGQTGHEVSAYGNTARSSHAHGIFSAGCGMAPVNVGKGLVMGRLQAQFQPEVAIKGCEQVELFVIKTVGAGSYGYSKTAGQLPNGLEQLLQAF